MHSRGLGHVNGRCINGSQDSFMGQRAGHEYGTGRTRIWDGTRLVGDEGLDGRIGHVNGTGLKGNPL